MLCVYIVEEIAEPLVHSLDSRCQRHNLDYCINISIEVYSFVLLVQFTAY